MGKYLVGNKMGKWRKNLFFLYSMEDTAVIGTVIRFQWMCSCSGSGFFLTLCVVPEVC